MSLMRTLFWSTTTLRLPLVEAPKTRGAPVRHNDIYDIRGGITPTTAIRPRPFPYSQPDITVKRQSRPIRWEQPVQCRSLVMKIYNYINTIYHMTSSPP